jgi:hypothetical protein
LRAAQKRTTRAFFPQNEMQGAFLCGATSMTSRIIWIGEQATDRAAPKEVRSLPRDGIIELPRYASQL